MTNPTNTNQTKSAFTPSSEHILITLYGPEPAETIAEIKRRYPGVKVTFVEINATDNFSDVSALSARVSDELWAQATVLITLFALPRDEALVPRLKYIHLFSAGTDHFSQHRLFHPTLTQIPISTSTGIAAPPIAEHVIMTLLSLTKRLPLQLSWQRQHHWGPKRPFMSSNGDWVGKTVGILGYGSIGRHVGRILVALGAVVHAYTASKRDTPDSRKDRNYCVPGTGDPEGKWPSKWFSGTDKADVDAFLGSGLHALIVAVPLTPATKRVLGRDEFALLQRTSPFPPSGFDAPAADADAGQKPAGAFVVNISRGAVVEQEALVEALKARVIRGAALDVTDPEPLATDSALWELDNCIVTPHTSGLGSEYTGRGFEVLFENLRRWDAGEAMLNVLRSR